MLFKKLNTKPSDLLELDRFNKIYQVTLYKLKFSRSQAIFNNLFNLVIFPRNNFKNYSLYKKKLKVII